MGDVIDLDQYRKKRAREDAKTRDRKSGRSGRGRRRERKASLPDPAARDESDADGTDDNRAD